MSTLYYGDDLDILRRCIKDESVDLVWLGPPFNSNASYNVLFAEQNGTRAAAQKGRVGRKVAKRAMAKATVRAMRSLLG